MGRVLKPEPQEGHLHHPSQSAGWGAHLSATQLTGWLGFLEGNQRNAQHCKDEVKRRDNERSIVEPFNLSLLSATLLCESNCFTNPESWSGSVGDN